MAKVCKRMALTFPHRRRMMNDKINLSDLKSEYPAIFDFNQVFN